MLLEAGPLPPITASQFQVTFDQPDFEQMTLDAWTQIDSVTLEMDSLIDPAAVFDDALTGDTMLDDLNSVDQVNGDNAHLVNLAGIPTIDGYKADGDAWLTLAIAETPGEAWTPVPASTAYGTVTPAAPTAQFHGVTLLDLTTMSGTNFRSGDLYQLQVKMDTTTGNIADYFQVHLYAELAKDQVQQPNLDLGTTDNTGLMTYQGQWSDFDAGSWTMFLHAQPTTGGDVVSQMYQWTVQPKNIKFPIGQQPAVTVVLTNLSSGDLNNSTVGDQWELDVSGPPGTDVFSWATHDGASIPEGQLGTTGTDGTFKLEGIWTRSDAGDWVEYYAVGRFTLTSGIAFTVQPAPPIGPP